MMISDAWQPHSLRLIANSFIVGSFLAFVRRRLVPAVHLNIGVMRDATFFPVIPHFLADKGIGIFAPNVAARADSAMPHVKTRCETDGPSWPLGEGL